MLKYCYSTYIEQPTVSYVRPYRCEYTVYNALVAVTGTLCEINKQLRRVISVTAATGVALRSLRSIITDPFVAVGPQEVDVAVVI